MFWDSRSWMIPAILILNCFRSWKHENLSFHCPYVPLYASYQAFTFIYYGCESDRELQLEFKGCMLTSPKKTLESICPIHVQSKFNLRFLFQSNKAIKKLIKMAWLEVPYLVVSSPGFTNATGPHLSVLATCHRSRGENLNLMLRGVPRMIPQPTPTNKYPFHKAIYSTRTIGWLVG